MRMDRSFKRSLAQLLACVLLLAQLAVAAYACPGLQSTSRSATVVAQGDETEVDAPTMPGCSDMDGIALDPDAANLCAEHCKVGQQSHEVPSGSVPPVALTALYHLHIEAVSAPSPRPAAARTDALVAASPALAILHCVFRI
jgi:hypothetical protein